MPVLPWALAWRISAVVRTWTTRSLHSRISFWLAAMFVDRGLEALPYRDGAVGGGQATLAHVFEEFAVPLGDDQPVDDDAVGVEFGGIHDGLRRWSRAGTGAGDSRPA